MEDENLEVKMDQQEHFHQPSGTKEHSRHAEVCEYQSYYEEDRTRALQAQEEERSTNLVQDGLTGLF